MEKKYSLTIIGILGKSLRTTFRNGKILFSIMLFIYLFLSFVEFGGDLVMKPLLKDLSHNPPKDFQQQFNDLDQFDKATLKDIKILLVLKLGTFVLSCAGLLFFATSTISSSSAAHTAKTLSLKDVLLWVKRKWVAVFITTIYMSLISVAVFTLFIILLGVGSLLTHGLGSQALKIGISALVGSVFYVYLVVVWVMSLVVSVVEDKCSGLKAIDRAREILKGQRLKACFIMVLFAIVGSVVYMSCLMVAGKLWNEKSARIGVSICTIWSLCFVKLFLLVVYTVFYHECKNIKEEEQEEEKEKLGLYLPITSGDV